MEPPAKKPRKPKAKAKAAGKGKAKAKAKAAVAVSDELPAGEGDQGLEEAGNDEAGKDEAKPSAKDEGLAEVENGGGEKSVLGKKSKIAGADILRHWEEQASGMSSAWNKIILPQVPSSNSTFMSS